MLTSLLTTVIKTTAFSKRVVSAYLGYAINLAVCASHWLLFCYSFMNIKCQIALECISRNTVLKATLSNRAEAASQRDGLQDLSVCVCISKIKQ